MNKKKGIEKLLILVLIKNQVRLLLIIKINLYNYGILKILLNKSKLKMI